MTPEQRANRILLDHARDAYTDPPRTAATVPIDRRCPLCGAERPVCLSTTCIRTAS